MLRTYHIDGTLPENDEIFVFGSNLAGRHGRGAAKIAVQRFGAIRGRGIGPQGKSYAIASKSRLLKPLPLSLIAHNVNVFILYARTKPELKFFITKIGCGLTGYRNSEIAPMFLEAPSNCSFAKEWKRWLE